ncbi:MAG: HAD family hydrolase [Gemmatimonadota bacterium]|nr:HAD family hydrolase [Gemmatimonadota bacterium]
MARRRIDAVIFDLDDTLFDCTGQLTEPARRRAALTLAAAIPDSDAPALQRMQATLADQLSSADSIREIARRHELPADVVEHALSAYNRDQVEDIAPFPDALSTLEELAARRYRLCLVTTGRPERQRRKVDLLGLRGHFSEESGTLVFHDDRRDPEKDEALQRAVRFFSLSPCRILSVGDKLNSEIAASKRLGMRTARMCSGRQKNQRPRTPEERPDHELSRLTDLLALLP